MVHPSRWKGVDFSGRVIPASVPALAHLLEAKIPHMRSDQILTRNDYQEIWRQELVEVCKGVTESLLMSETAGPNWGVLTAYPLYLLLVQKAVIEKMFDRIYQNGLFREIRIESLDEQGTESDLGFYGCYSNLYPWVALQWASERKIEILSLSGPQARSSDSGCRPGKRGRWHPRTVLKQSYVMGQHVVDWVTLIMKALSAGIRRNRNIIFYVPFPQAGLFHQAPVDAINVKPLIDFIQWSGRLLFRENTSALPIIQGFSPMKFFNNLHPMVYHRLKNFISQSWTQGWAVFRVTSQFADLCQRRIGKIGWVAATPFAGPTPFGLVAEAFRGRQIPVGGVQHGGNYRLCYRGAVPFRLWDGMGGGFFQWGKGDSDESGDWLEAPPLRVVTTGAPWMQKLMRHARRRHILKHSAVLYCPTLLSIETISGANIVWDKYLPLMLKVLEILNESSFQVTVKILPNKEMDYVDWTRYPNLNVVRSSTFWRLMGNHKVILIDGLPGSPLFEAMATDSSIILYEASENMSWDNDFLQKLRRRVVCCPTEEAYIESIRAFLAEGASFFPTRGVQVSSEILDDYLTPVASEQFWRSVQKGLFSIKELPHVG